MNNLETLRSVFDVMMTISVRGNDVIAMSNCLQTLDSVIRNMAEETAKQTETPVTIEPEVVSE